MAVPSMRYGDVQNAIKEIDMQIVYRRLEARKKNITNDGKMSKKHMASAYRGYHGLEAQYHAMVRMSDETMMNAKAKNDHLNLKHTEDMKVLEEQRRTVSRQSRREIESISEEFRAQLAYQYVYKNHSFKRLDPSAKSQKKSRPTSDKPEMYDPERKQSASVKRSPAIIRPLGSLRQMENYRNELKLPVLVQSGKDKREPEKSKVNMMGEKNYADRAQDVGGHSSETHEQTKSFPKIEGAMGIEIKYRYKSRDDDKDSLFSAPAGVVDDAYVVYAGDQPPLAQLDMGRNLMIMRQKEQENYKRQRLLPSTPNSDESKKKGWRRVLPATPSRPSTGYPRQETNPIDHKKAMRKEVSEMIKDWDHENTKKRFEMVEKVKQLEREHDRENPPPTFDRSRPTSAILRDFQQYKKAQEERRYAVENNQPITVKQLTVQPRPESPSLTRRNQYSAQIQAPSNLKRTFSEKSDKFSSVSRTASFHEIPEDPHEIAANALLTAAERIEKEREKRNSAKSRVNERSREIKVGNEAERTVNIPSPVSKDDVGDKRETSERRRRVLPQTPRSSDGGQKDPTPHRQQSGRQYKPSEVYLQNAKAATKTVPKKKHEKMFDTSVLARSSDNQTIDEVQKANMASDNPLPLRKLRPGTPGSYTDDISSDSPTSVYMFSAKPIPQNIRQRMKFEYDNYSRTSPNMKKKLEIRAKNRRKIQQENKLLLEGRRDSPIKDSDRASTQVSFNENVMVFQTI